MELHQNKIDVRGEARPVLLAYSTKTQYFSLLPLPAKQSARATNFSSKVFICTVLLTSL